MDIYWALIKYSSKVCICIKHHEWQQVMVFTLNISIFKDRTTKINHKCRVTCEWTLRWWKRSRFTSSAHLGVFVWQVLFEVKNHSPQILRLKPDRLWPDPTLFLIAHLYSPSSDSCNSLMMRVYKNNSLLNCCLWLLLDMLSQVKNYGFFNEAYWNR